MKRVSFIFFILILFLKSNLLFSQSYKETSDSTDFYKQKGDFKSALIWAEKAYILAGKEFGMINSKYIDALLTYAAINDSLGNFEEEIKTIDICRKIIGEANGIKDDLFINYTTGIGKIYMNNIRDYAKALPYLIEAHNLCRITFSSYNEDFDNSLLNLAMCLQRMGRYAEAQPYYEELLGKRIELYGDKDGRTSSAYTLMGRNFDSQGKYAEAEKYHLEGIAILKKISPEGDIQFKGRYESLINCLQKQFKYKEAEFYFKESYEMLERIYKGDHFDLAKAKHDYGNFLAKINKFGEAEILMKESLDMAKRVFKEEQHDLLTMCLNDLGWLYDKMELLDYAEKYFLESLELKRRFSKNTNENLIISITNLGYWYHRNNNFEKAEPLYKESIELARKNGSEYEKLLPTLLSNLGGFYLSIGSYEESRNLLQEALDLQLKITGENHPATILIMNNLGGVYSNLDSLDRAEGLFRRADEINQNLNGIPKEKFVNNIHIADILYRNGKYLEAIDIYNKNFNKHLETIKNTFPFLSELEREKFIRKMKDDFEGFNARACEIFNKVPQVNEISYNNQLATKGILLNSVSVLRQNIINSGDSTLSNKYDSWINYRENLIQYQRLSEAQLKEKSINLDSIQIIINDLEKELSHKSSKFSNEMARSRFTWLDIKNVLKEDEAAIEIVRFRKLGKVPLKNKTDRYEYKLTDTVCYAALIVKKNTTVAPELVVLENGNELENKFMNKYTEIITEFILEYKNPEIKTDAKLSIQTLNLLYRNFWEKIESQLAGIKKVYLSPDGVYNKININTLINPETNKYLIAEKDIRIISSTRDLLRRNPLEKNRGKKLACLFGNIKYNLDNAKYQQLASLNKDEILRGETGHQIKYDDTLTRKGFSPLQSTKAEIEKISQLMNSNDWEVKIYDEENASEEILKSITNPDVLHLATHGNFLEDIEIETSESKKSKSIYRQNPLLRSYLAFAGAENTAMNNEYSNMNTDVGILSAYEVVSLNLENTELVVLSACNTGLGEIKNGEGVYGMQRAFQIAGAKCLLMSLWQVPDKATQELMTSFYTKWLSGKTKREAFWEAQLQLMNKYDNFYYWGAFVMVGE